MFPKQKREQKFEIYVGLIAMRVAEGKETCRGPHIKVDKGMIQKKSTKA
jgi:hypothetical protein